MEWLFSVARLFYDHHDRNRMLQSTIVDLTRNDRYSTASFSSHSKPRTMAYTRLLKCFVLQHSVIKSKHLRSLVQGVIQDVLKGFE